MPPTATLTGTAFDRAATIAERCGGGREHAKGWMVRCPAHDDRSPSLHVTPKESRVLLKCFAGCTVTAILEVLSLTYQDLFEQDDWQRSSLPKPQPKTKRRPAPEGGADPFALAFAVDLVIDDVEMLTVEGCVETLRQASANPLQWLWVERAFAEAGMSPSVVWQVLYPHAEEPYLYAVSHDTPVTYEQRLAARLRRDGHARKHRS